MGSVRRGEYGKSSPSPNSAAAFAYPFPFATSAKLPVCQGGTGLLGFLFPVGSFVIESPAVLRFICLPPERQWGRQAGAARGGWLPELPGIHGLCIFTRLKPPLHAPVGAASWA